MQNSLHSLHRRLFVTKQDLRKKFTARFYVHMDDHAKIKYAATYRWINVCRTSQHARSHIHVTCCVTQHAYTRTRKLSLVLPRQLQAYIAQENCSYAYVHMNDLWKSKHVQHAVEPICTKYQSTSVPCVLFPVAREQVLFRSQGCSELTWRQRKTVQWVVVQFRNSISHQEIGTDSGFGNAAPGEVKRELAVAFA